MDWFLADLLVHQVVKPKISKKHSNQDFKPKFSIQFIMYFHLKKVKEITQYFTAATMPKDNDIV